MLIRSLVMGQGRIQALLRRTWKSKCFHVCIFEHVIRHFWMFYGIDVHCFCLLWSNETIQVIFFFAFVFPILEFIYEYLSTVNFDSLKCRGLTAVLGSIWGAKVSSGLTVISREFQLCLDLWAMPSVLQTSYGEITFYRKHKRKWNWTIWPSSIFCSFRNKWNGL